MSLSPEEIRRYTRQIILKEVGGAGQNALKSARVLIIGAGGLGGPASLYLAAAGIGEIGLVDFDTVELSNLHRQIQFETKDLGRAKTKALATRLHALNPHTKIIPYEERLDQHTASTRIAGYNLVLDGTDDFATRFAINQACLDHHTPLVSGALGRFDGQLGIFCAGKDDPCYQCFVPEIPRDAETCEAVGIVGAMAGILGAMMALETIKFITEAGPVLRNKLMLFEGLHMRSRVVHLSKDPKCKACSAKNPKV